MAFHVLFLIAALLQWTMASTIPYVPASSKAKAHLEPNNTHDHPQEESVVILSGSEFSGHGTDEALGSDEKSVSLGFKNLPSITLEKRDLEKEAPSSNGKVPYYLFKKDLFYHPNTRRYLGSAAAFTANERVFPTYGSVGRYERRRRSFQSDALPELQLNMDNAKEKEAFLQLMAFLSTKENQDPNYNLYKNLLSDAILSNMVKSGDDDEGTFQDAAEDENLPLPIDLGYYGDTQQLFPKASGYDGIKDVERTQADLARLGINLSEIPDRDHGLYLSPQEYPHASTQQRQQDGEWMEDAVPLQTHFNRRSDNTFRYNPAMAFRQYYRSIRSPSENFGSFSGPIYPPVVRNRRSLKPEINHFTM